MLRKKASVFQRKYLPPTIGLLDEAGLFADDTGKILEQRLGNKGFRKEASGIAKQTLETYNYCDEGDKMYTGFNITLGESLDILSPGAGCTTPRCRCDVAINVARTAGLFAGKLFVTDHLSPLLSVYRNDEVHLRYLKMMTSVLRMLAPLIDNGVIDLRAPRSHCCPECLKKIDEKIESFFDTALDREEIFEVTYLHHKNGRHRVMIHTPEFQRLYGTYSYGASLSEKDFSSSHLDRTKRVFSAKFKDEPFFVSWFGDLFRDEMRRTVFGIDSARRTSSLYLAKSSAEALFLSSIDRVQVQKKEMAQWEAMRSLSLPWIGDLNINQILKLRDEASISLELLRDRILLGFMHGGKQQVTDVINDLTREISELGEEILKNKIARQSHNKYALEFGSLAIALVLYGLASTVPAAAVGSVAALLASISHLHASEEKVAEREAKIITSPAYALLKARDLLSCKE